MGRAAATARRALHALRYRSPSHLRRPTARERVDLAQDRRRLRGRTSRSPAGASLRPRLGGLQGARQGVHADDRSSGTSRRDPQGRPRRGAHALRQQYSHITPGYHMNKKHWITLESGGGVDKELVRQLVTDSYRLVVAHLPRAERPVDPHTYSTGT